MNRDLACSSAETTSRLLAALAPLTSIINICGIRLRIKRRIRQDLAITFCASAPVTLQIKIKARIAYCCIAAGITCVRLDPQWNARESFCSNLGVRAQG